MQDIANRLTKYDPEDLEKVDLIGARAYFKTTLYRLKGNKRISSAASKHKNLLKKSTVFRNLDHVFKVLEKWADGKPFHVWMSHTLNLDFNLPVENIPERTTLQAVVLCMQRPALVLTLYEGEPGGAEDVKRKSLEFALEIAQLLSSALLNFCHCEFVLLPCSLHSDFISENNLETEIDDQTKHITKFYSIPDGLSLSTFTDLTTAMSAVASATYVPCFYQRSNDRKVQKQPTSLLLLEDDWHDLLSLLIELLWTNNRKDQDLTYTQKSKFKGKGQDLTYTEESEFMGKGQDLTYTEESEFMGKGQDLTYTEESAFKGKGQDLTYTEESEFKGKGQDLTYTEESEFKVKAAVVEAAKRLSIHKTVVLVTTDENLRLCAREMMEHATLDEEMEMKLQVVSPEEILPPASIVICIDVPSLSIKTTSLSVFKREMTFPTQYQEFISVPLFGLDKPYRSTARKRKEPDTLGYIEDESEEKQREKRTKVKSQ